MAEQLEIASQQGDVRRVRWLIRHFPSLIKPQRGFDIPPLLWASLHGHGEVCQTLLSLGVDANSQAVNGDNALHAACEAGAAEVCQILLEAGTDPRHATPDGFTPAMIAAQRGHTQALRALLQADRAVVSAADAQGHTPLFHAVVFGWEECVSALVEAGACLDWTDSEGFTALDQAKMNKREGCRRLLQVRLSSYLKAGVWGWVVREGGMENSVPSRV
jgi:ankyrin repeat protein